MSEAKKVTEMLQEIADEMCDKYCKYPDIWDEEAEGKELSESEICRNCPPERNITRRKT